MAKIPSRGQAERFCSVYLQTMDPLRAARETGCPDGYALLENQGVRDRLEKMRAAGNAQILREDAVRALAGLAFGRSNDAVALALAPSEQRSRLAELDLSAVTEFKVTDKGGVELRLLDRVRALEALCSLLDGRCESGAESFFQALDEAGSEEDAT
ncbi:MAG: terminase small subunit [Oscillibacter sp.]|jgi:hypothetical protein|nr:terminase small subunit [Oscillibacter sp.]